MRQVLLAGGSVLALASAAAAADLSGRNASPPRDWSGYYLGINGGGGWGTSKWDTIDLNLSGRLIGGTIGSNWRAGGFIFGLEGDIAWSNIKGAALCPFGCATSNSWLATGRGRLGFAINSFMPYVTGGFAVGDVRAQAPLLPGNHVTNVGWTMGAGLELALLGTFSAKAEYLYVDLGAFNCGLLCGASVVNNVSFNSHLLRGGLNFRF